MHFNNIIYVEENKKIIYNFNTTKFTFENNYTLRVFDYDYSYYEELGENPMIISELCESIYGVCNKKTNKDLWTLIVSIILLFKNETLSTSIKNILRNILKILTNNLNDTDLDIIISIILNFEGVHKHRLCTIDLEKKLYTANCGTDLYSLDILKIIDTYYNTFISSQITSSMTMQKYLKYKTKYYNIKNKLINTN